MLRYRTRDLTSLTYEKCACGRTAVRMGRILGRSDDMLIIRGVNVFPSQVESVILELPEVEAHYLIVVDRMNNTDTFQIQVEVRQEYYSDEMNKMIALKKKIAAEREETVKRAFEDALMQKVADGIQADIPDEMVDVQAQQMMENFQQQLAAQGIPFDQYLKMTNTTEDDFKKQAHDPAVQQVRMDLAVAALVKAENLEATAQEIEDELKTVADKYGMDLDTIKKYLPEADVREQVLRSKAIKAVADAAVAVAPVVEESQEEAKQEEEKKDAE